MGKKVAVLGWFGHRNFGDDLILDGLCELFRGWQVHVFTSDHVSGYPYLDIDAVNKCDLFVLGGGELINSDFLFMPAPSRFKIPSLSYRLYAHSSFAHSPWTHKIKIPKVILGCGVNVENSSQLKSNVIKDLEQFNYIGLRDNVAVSILDSIPRLKGKVHLFHDLAFSVNVPNLHWKHSEDTAVVIPTDRLSYGDRGVKEHLIASKSSEWLNERLKTYKETVFLSFGEQDNNDYLTCLLLAHSNSEIVKATSLNQVLSLIGEATITFPYRLHGLILSFLVGTKYEFYPYHWKVQRVHDSIQGFVPKEIREKQRKIVDEIVLGKY